MIKTMIILKKNEVSSRIRIAILEILEPEFNGLSDINDNELKMA
jgi:hypothetical protein